MPCSVQTLKNIWRHLIVFSEIVHFRSLSEREQNCSVNYEKYAKLCEDLLEEFTIRFSYFKMIEIELKLFSDPF